MRNSSRLLSILSLAIVLAGVSAITGERPNILLIVADDLGYADIGVHGCKDVATPHIDSIAKHGVRFSNGYVSGPYCSPTRAALLTARYQQRYGHELNPGPARTTAPDVGLPRTETTLAERLKTHGYATGLVGKWHLGYQPAFHPQKRGFDTFFGFLGGAHSYVDNADAANPVMRGTEPVSRITYLTDMFGDEAVAFVERQRRAPWFLYLAFNADHAPMQAPERYLARVSHIKDPLRQKFAAMHLALDDNVGKVLAALRTHRLEEQTLIVFVSDNGGPTRVNASRNDPLRGFKAQTWEGGIRVPFLMQWKGTLPAGTLYTHPVMQIDVAPTALAAAGADVKAEWKLDGVNLLPYLKGAKTSPPHDTLYWRFGAQMAIRMGDWKLVKAPGAGADTPPARGGVANVDGAHLYNLATDIGEQRNLADAEPDTVKRLGGAWQKWNAELEAPRWRPGRAGVTGAPASARRPLTHQDYDAWRSIFTPALSRDGRYLAYSFMPQDGDGDLIVRDLQTGQERRVPVGALPPPPIQNPEEVNPEEPPAPRTIRISITSDSRFVVATTYPSKSEAEQAKREKKKVDEMPKGGLVVVDVASGQVARIAAVRSLQMPARGGSWAAYLKEASSPAHPKEEPSPALQGREARGSGGSRGDRPEYGADLVLRDLAQGTERTFPNVLEYSFARDGKTLLYTVSSRTDTENGVYSVTPASAGAPVALLAGKGKYAKMTWNRAETEVAFMTDRDDASSKPSRFKVYRWQRGTPAASEIVSSSTPGFPSNFVISERGPLAFSRDGRKLYVPAAPPARPAQDPDAQASNDDRVLVDLWHWQDDLVQPMQRIRANQERNRTYRGVYHIAERTYVQLADASMRTVSLSDDGRRAIGYDDAPYRRMVDYDGNYSDVYMVDTTTGTRKLALKQLRGGGGRGGGGGGPLQWSPDGRSAVYFQDEHWHLLDAAAGTTRSVTSALGVAVHDEDDDTPDPAGSYGSAGWTSDSQSFLIYDRFDVWQIFTDGRPARNLTEGEGRKTQTALRIERIDPVDEDEDERGLDPKGPIYLRGASEETRATGFFREDLHVADASFRLLDKVTNGGAQKEPFLWGSAELVRFRNTDGVPLSAALYKPENFDPKKKYPLIVYIYEQLSQNVHNFVAPRPGHSVNFAHYVSNGYLILTPDIVYTIGQPGQSALKCVLPAIQEVVDKGFVDEKAIGIQGHSWGGYQIAYMVTQTNRFRAAEAGAPVGNMTSAYSGIRWGSGLPRQFQYENTQSRIGRPLYDAPHKYIENSPVFHVQRVKTPLLILHDDQDDAVPWYQGIELFLALRRTGKEAYLFNYNGELHGLRRRHNQKDFAVRMQQFFDHFLKGAPKPEWMEKGIPFIEREAEKERIQKATSS